MQLRWEHLDERVSVRVHEYLSQAETPASHEAASASSGAVQSARHGQAAREEPLDLVWSVFAACIAFFVVALYGTVCFHLTGPLVTLAILGLPVGVAAASWLPPILSARNAHKPAIVPPVRRTRGPVSAETVKQALATGTRTRAERLYSEVIVSLTQTEAAKKSPLPFSRRKTTETDAHRLLRECNALLSHSFRLEAETRRIAALWNPALVEDLEAERFALLRKMDNETDPIARQSLKDSVSLCDARIEKVRSYPLLLSRLDAHQEMVCQSLALASATLAHHQAAPHALHAPETHGLRAALRRIAQQTRAVEDAVLELSGDLRQENH